ncbi:unnamed protein product [Lampetra fluviatilis]
MRPQHARGLLLLALLTSVTFLLSYRFTLSQKQQRQTQRQHRLNASLQTPLRSTSRPRPPGGCCRTAGQRTPTSSPGVGGGGNGCHPAQTEAFEPVPGAPVLVVSAYWDDRETPGGAARFLAVVERGNVGRLRCLLCCPGEGEDSAFVLPVPATISIHESHFGFPWGLAFVSCDLPVDGVVPADRPRGGGGGPVPGPVVPGYRRRSRRYRHDFSVCISTMWGGYNNVLQFAQTLEMYRLLGATLVTVYSSGAGPGPQLAALLAVYDSRGFVETVPWPVGRHLKPSAGWHYPNHPGQLHYHGQVAALNDCVHRRAGDSRYVVLNDADEVIMPSDDDDDGEGEGCVDWACLLGRVRSERRGGKSAAAGANAGGSASDGSPNDGGDFDSDASVAVYVFESHVFPYTAADGPSAYPGWGSSNSSSSSSSSGSSDSAVPGRDITRMAWREPSLPAGSFNPTKLVVDPRAVTSTSVHAALRLRGGGGGATVEVPPRLARMHHYRTPEQPQLPRAALVPDASLRRCAAGRLVGNVNAALRLAGLLP